MSVLVNVSANWFAFSCKINVFKSFRASRGRGHIPEAFDRKGRTTLVRGYCTTVVGRVMFLQEWAMAMNVNVHVYQCRLW